MKKLNQPRSKYKFILIGPFILLSVMCRAQHPFKYDSLYKTIYAKELCKLIGDDPNVVLIDVRSAGEFYDTSHYASLNKGHLKGAINISIASINNNIHVLDPYKDKKVVLYCSHSQRSRRISKLLSENGYTNHYNLNGGMTSLNELISSDFPCKEELIVSNSKYKQLSCEKTVEFLKNEKDPVIIDVRPIVLFNSKDSITENNVGRIKKAIHITFDDLKSRIGELDRYKRKPVLVYSASGDGDGARAAAGLVSNGFTNVNLLLPGINDFILNKAGLLFIENGLPFNIVNPYDAILLLNGQKRLVVFDTRDSAEYNNNLTGRGSFKNLGHIKNAISMGKEKMFSTPVHHPKNEPVLIYGNEEATDFAFYLHKQGYEKVFLLSSYYDFVWSSFNVENCKEAKLFLTDHSGLY